MSNTQRSAIAAVVVLAAVTLAVSMLRRNPEPTEPPPDSAPGTAATDTGADIPLSPGDPPPEMRPGEVRAGAEPGTLLVKPFGPHPPKEISSNYRVPSHRDDARVTKLDDGSVVFEEAIALARRLHAPEVAPEEDLEILDAILRYYRLVYASNPVAGENSEVMRALTGSNPHKIVVFPRDHPSIDGSGTLLDRWGEPYFFHALSGTELDIWSAGPDRKRNSPDDLKLGLENPSQLEEG